MAFRLLVHLLFLFPLAFSHPNFIIIGGGTSGSVLAGRLCTSLPHARITLLERGAPRTSSDEFLIRSPRNTWDSWTSPSVSQTFLSAPNAFLDNATSTIITGNTLGGSSSINGAQCVVPTNGTVQAWGIEGLNEAVARRFFRKALHQVGCRKQPESLRQKFWKAYITASKRAGFEVTEKPFEGGNGRVVALARVAVDEKGRRRDAYTAYVKPVIGGKCKSNLRVVLGARVTRVLFKGLRAVGVEYEQGGIIKKMKAENEVLMSAGPFMSPALLQLSGVGRSELLKKLRIPLVKDLGVGERTLARPATFVLGRYEVGLEPANDPTLVESEREKRKFENGAGGVFATAIAPMDVRLGKTGYFGFTSILPRTAGFGENLMTGGCLITSTARGKLEIVSKNGTVAPNVELNYLGNERDRKRMRSCLKDVVKVYKNMPFKVSILGDIGNEEFIRASTTFGFHYVGGCQVGKVLEKKGFRVKGIKGLRIVDASVLRTLPKSAGPMMSVYMVAEFAAQGLIDEYQGRFGMKMKRWK